MKDARYLVPAVRGLVGRPPADHGHLIADIAGLDAALAGKAPLAHTHAIGDISGLQAALEAILAAAGTAVPENGLINGCCRVSTREAALLAGSPTPGAVDLWAVWADGTIGGGSVEQDDDTALAISGHALRIAEASLGSGGALRARQRIEARDACRFVGRPARFGCRLQHDFGAAADVTVALRRATADDDFASPVDIGGDSQAVAPGAAVDLSVAIADMGDCRHGIEVEIAAACGAVSSRTLAIADLRLAPGTVLPEATAPPLAGEIARVRRFLRPVAGIVGKANSATNMQALLAHPGLRAPPTYSATAPLAFTDAVTADFTQSTASVGTVHDRTAEHGRVDLGFFAGLSVGAVLLQRGTGGTVLASAEL